MENNGLSVYDLMVGRDVIVPTEVKVDVRLTIKSVKPNYHSEDIGPSTRENDWYPEQRTWTTYEVTFTNGAVKTYSDLNSIRLVKD